MAALRKTLLLLLVAATAAGCGAARTEADLGAAYARIQVEEARIEHASPASARCEGEPCERIADATAQICSIADEIDEHDARARCEAARRRARLCDACHE